MTMTLKSFPGGPCSWCGNRSRKVPGQLPPGERAYCSKKCEREGVRAEKAAAERMNKCKVEGHPDPDYGNFPYECKTHHYVFPMGVIGGTPCPESDAPMEEKLKRRKWEAEYGGGGLSWAEKFGIDRKRLE